MEILYSREELDSYLHRYNLSDPTVMTGPLLIDRFLDDAVEIDVDALYDGQELFLGGVMEHIEEAGIHSGDSSCVLPPITLSDAIISHIRTSTEKIAAGVGVRGLINIQYALVSGVLYVIEANPRASRTVPFVAKATGVPLARAAALVMMGSSIAQLKQRGYLPADDSDFATPGRPIAVKEAVLPFKRFRDKDGRIVDTVLGPEMRSTGEVMGYDRDFPTAFAKSQTAAYGNLPTSGTVFVSVSDQDKRSLALPVSRLFDLGFSIMATSGTAALLRRYGIPLTEVRKASQGIGPGGEQTVVDMIRAGLIDMVINTPGTSGARADGYEIRTATTSADKPIITTISQFQAAVQAIEATRNRAYGVCSLQEYDKAKKRDAS